MKLPDAVQSLDEALNQLAKLYQFRSVDEPLYAGLTVSQSYTLRSLFLVGAQSMGALATDLGVRVSTMTGIIDQLEGKGLVERADHPSDRRSYQVRLTAAGRRIYQSARDTFLAHLEPVLRRRSPVERARILDFLTDVTHAIHAWREDVERTPA